MTSLQDRAQLDARYTWALESVFPGEDAWAAAFGQIEADLPRLSAYQGRLGESASTLRAFLEVMFDLQRRLGHVYVYSDLHVATDQDDQAAVARHGRSQGLYARVMSALAFVEPELLALPEGTLEAFQAQDEKLRVYGQYFRRLQERRSHVRSPEVEALFGALGEVFSGPYNTWSSLVNADLKFSPVPGEDGQDAEVANGTIDVLLSSPRADVRRAAFRAYADGFLSHRNTFAQLLLTSVRQTVLQAREHGYDSAREAVLLPQDVPPTAMDAVTDTFEANLGTWHRYWRARRKLLGVQALGPWDVHATLGSSVIEVPYERAVEWILEGLRPLGLEYTEPLRRGLTQDRWVDVYPTRGKASNAFSHGSHGTRPFILMNYVNDLPNMSVLAHELGHSMHSYLTWEAQPSVYGNYGMFVAETASNFNQAMLRAHLLERESERAFVTGMMDEAFANFYRYFFVMPTLARLEKRLYAAIEAGEGVSADQLTDWTAELFMQGYGDEISLTEEDRQRVGITWAQFGHLYAPFYVFQYATGISAANALASGVLAGEQGARERYLQFLRLGSSVPQLDALKIAGVDMTTSAPIERGFQVLADLVERLEQLAEG